MKKVTEKSKERTHAEIAVISKRQRNWAIASAFAALLLYLYGIPSVSGDKDGSEFTLILATGGVTHPTGYPLYTIIGHWYCYLLHSIGVGWPTAANSFSAVGAAFSVFFFCRLSVLSLTWKETRALSNAESALIICSVFVFAVNPSWGYDAKIAEVYSWHTCWALAFVLTTIQTIRSWNEKKDIRQRRINAVIIGILSGIGMSHHLTAMFILFPCFLILLYCQVRNPLFGLKELLILPASFLIPLASYYYVYHTSFHPSGVVWGALEPDIGSVIRHITGADYRHFIGKWNPSPFQKELMDKTVWPILVPGFLLGLIAFFRSENRHRIYISVPLLVVLSVTAYNLNYGIPDPISYFHVPIALCLSSLPLFLITMIGNEKSSSVIVTIAFVFSIVTVFTSINWLRASADMKKSMEGFDRLVHDMWSKIPMDTAFVVWSDDAVHRLSQYQLLDHEKTGLYIINPGQLAHPSARKKFEERFGFDAVGSSDTIQNAIRRGEVIARNIRSRSDIPVIIFDPANRSMRLLEKQ